MIISNRASLAGTNPKYGNIVEKMENSLFYQWKISGMTELILSFESTPDIMRVALLDTMASFLRQENYKNLFTINAREIENYLRDQNDIPAFAITIDVIFDQLLVELTRTYFHFIAQKILINATVIERNAFWTNHFKTFLGVEFVLYDKSSLYFLNKRSESIVSFDISE
jgi:hypothetical protein